MDSTYVALSSTFVVPRIALHWPPIQPFTPTLIHQLVVACKVLLGPLGAIGSCPRPFDHWTTCSTNWATAAHINDSWVCWMSRRAEYLGCAQEIFVKSTLPIPNSLYCCRYQLLFWASAPSKCWQLWRNTTFSRKSRFCRQKMCLEVRVWRRCREHGADCCANITVIWFSRGRVMMCFSLEKLCLHPAKWYLEETAQPVPIPYFHRLDQTQLYPPIQEQYWAISEETYSIWQWRGWNIVAAVWTSTPPTLVSVLLVPNTTTQLCWAGWLATNAGWRMRHRTTAVSGQTDGQCEEEVPGCWVVLQSWETSGKLSDIPHSFRFQSSNPKNCNPHTQLIPFKQEINHFLSFQDLLPWLII